MKIVIAIDSFKGSASSAELNQAVKAGILAVSPACKVESFAVADGGEGTIAALQAGLGGELITVPTVDLLERPLSTQYLLVNDRAIIESAEIVGLDKITPSAGTVQKATTRGLAALFLDAKARGAREIILSLGGSGTSDGGLGLLEGLGGDLEQLPTLLADVKITGLADVTNVYAGNAGYAKVFGRQKGATDAIIEQQDMQAEQVAKLVKEKYQIDLQAITGSGAAGGLGAAIILLGGSIQPGFNKIADLLGLEAAIKTADLVITGEGRMDYQTAKGKVPFGMAKIAQKYHIPVMAFCGALGNNLDEMERLLLAAYSIQRGPISLAEAIKKEQTLFNIRQLTKNVLRTWLNRS